MLGSLQIARGELDVDSIQALQPRGHLSGHRDRPMPPSRAAEGDDELGPTALAIVRQRVFHGALEVVEQFLRRRLADDEFAHARVAAAERSQLVNPVRVVEQAHVYDPRRTFGDASLVSEGETGDEHLLAGLELLRQLAELSDIHTVMRAVVAAACLAIVGADMDKRVADAARIGVLEHDGAVSTESEHAVRVIKRRQPARELVAGVDEHSDGIVQLPLGRAANDDESHRVSFNRLARRSGTPRATISSTAASRIACTEPKCRSSARFRAGPMPSTESSGDVNAFRERTLR